LSKCWKLITRFSEDIDLAIDRSVLGYSGDLSRTQIKALKKDAAQLTSTLLKDDFVEQLNGIGVPEGMISVASEEIKPDHPDKDPQTLFLHYPTLFQSLAYLPNVVKIEVSALSLREPFANCPVGSLLYEYFPSEFYKEEPFTVPAIEPHRTFLEKAFLLHEELARPDRLKTDRKSRHFYDLVMLMDTAHGKKALEDGKLYETIVAHRSLFYKLPGVDYTTHSPDRINFVPGIDLLSRFESDYRLMQTQMIYGEPPEYSKLMELLRTLRWRFRKKKPLRLPYGCILEDVIKRGEEMIELQGFLKNAREMQFMSVVVQYPLDIEKPPSSVNVDRSYRVSFIFLQGRLMVDDVQVVTV
jgi:hypothetical protein